MSRTPMTLGLTFLLACCSATARADDAADARAEYRRAMAAFALGKFAEAAERYERAFALHADPALLYDAAQSQRMAGNQQRALMLYVSLTRVFAGRVPHRDEVERHIDELRAAIESDERARTAPATTPLSLPPPPQEPAQATPQTQPTQPTQPTPRASLSPPELPSSSPLPSPSSSSSPLPSVETRSRSLFKKPWLWAVAGGGVVVIAVGVGLAVGLGARPSEPTASFGAAAVR
jgi:hypothetical protein